MSEADALFEAGRAADAIDIAHALAIRGADEGDRVAELTGRILEASWATHLEPEGATDRLEALIVEVLPELEAAGADLALYIAESARGVIANMRGRAQDWLTSGELALQHAKRAGQPHLAIKLIPQLGAAQLFGPTPVLDLLTWLDAQDVAYPGNTANEVHRAGALAMLGRFADARELMNAARERARDRAATIGYALITGQPAVDLELLADDPARAVELSRRAAACSRIKPKDPGCRRSWACRPSPSIVSACSTTQTPRPAEPASWGRATIA